MITAILALTLACAPGKGADFSESVVTLGHIKMYEQGYAVAYRRTMSREIREKAEYWSQMHRDFANFDGTCKEWNAAHNQEVKTLWEQINRPGRGNGPAYFYR